MRQHSLALILLFSLFTTSVIGQSYQSTLDMRTLATPTETNLAGKPSVYYELLVMNFASSDLRLKQLAIRSGDGQPVVTFNAEELKKRYQSIGLTGKQSEPIIPVAASGIIYLEYPLPVAGKIKTLVHTLTFEMTVKQESQQVAVTSSPTPLAQKSVVVGPPLGTGKWAAINDPSWERGHRRVIYTMNGKARLPGRFAIDFMLLDDQGKYFKGNEDDISTWYGYKVDVLAVADGMVASTRNDFPESKTISGHAGMDIGDGAGNYVSIKIGEDRYAFYEHLVPGSIRVKPGQRVKKGEVIASLGYTGSTTGPHLHFHVADADSSTGAEGIAFVFEKYVLLGTYPDFSQFGKNLWHPESGQKLNERPAPNSVIQF